jgi:predicted nucleotidyltransferase
MPNPRYLSREGEPTVDLLMRLYKAKKTYFENLDDFCEREFINKDEMSLVSKVYLAGSHASKNNWMDETSDIDFVLVNPLAVPENLARYKRKVLNPILCSSERKRDWVDLYFVRRDYQVTEPRINITKDWNTIKLD